MQVQIIKSYRDHIAGTIEECTGGQADLLINVMQIAEPVEEAKKQKPKKATKGEA